MNRHARSEPVASWQRNIACCDECGTDVSGAECPNCGQHADASWVNVVGFVYDNDDGTGGSLTLVEQHRNSWTVTGTRPLQPEQIDFLQRERRLW
jgi:hypothetical protein